MLDVGCGEGYYAAKGAWELGKKQGIDMPIEAGSVLAGAYAMVISDQANEKCAEVAANMTYLELSTYPGYMDSFVAACFIPHTDRNLFPNSVQEG